MDNKITYHEQNDIDNTLKLREVLKTLPPFCRESNVQRQNHVGFHS